jgi:hypothetical protein
MKTEYKYIYFNLHPIQSPGRKTKVWLCCNKSTDIVLAEIKWWPAWRQYCLLPESYMIFNKGCLLDIIDFFDQLNKCVAPPSVKG